MYLQEVSPDPGGQFQTVKCLAVMTELQKNSDLVSDGGLVKLDVCLRVTTVDGTRERQIRPCFAFIYFSIPRIIEKTRVK